jgi:hypothetical protein
LTVNLVLSGLATEKGHQSSPAPEFQRETHLQRANCSIGSPSRVLNRRLAPASELTLQHRSDRSLSSGLQNFHREDKALRSRFSKLGKASGTRYRRLAVTCTVITLPPSQSTTNWESLRGDSERLCEPTGEYMPANSLANPRKPPPKPCPLHLSKDSVACVQCVRGICHISG